MYNNGFNHNVIAKALKRSSNSVAQRFARLKQDAKMEKSNKKYKIGVIGSRDYNDFETIYKYLDSKISKIESLVSGGCPTGPDRAAEIYAKNKGLSITIHYPDWSQGKSAAFIRNEKIAKDCDILVAWQVKDSRGTANTIDTAERLGKKVVLFKFND